MRSSRLRIDEPCHENWGAMRPEGARRFCDRCDKHVHDLSALTEAEAEALLAQRDAKLCVRYSADATGAIVFKSAPLVPVTALRRRPLEAAAMALALAACTPHEQPRSMGEPMPVVIDDEVEPTPPQVEIPTVAKPPVIEREKMGQVVALEEPCEPVKPPPAPVHHVKMGRVALPRGG